MHEHGSPELAHLGKQHTLQHTMIQYTMLHYYIAQYVQLDITYFNMRM